MKSIDVDVIESEWTTLKVNDLEMDLFISKPKLAKIVPALIILQEAFGVNGHIQEVTKRFAREGYYTVAPDLFHCSAGARFLASYENLESAMPHLKAMTLESLTADLKAVFHFLQGLNEVNSALIGSVGFCMGGRASFFTNSILPLKAAISFYGGNIVPDLLSLAAKQHAPLLLFWGGQDTYIPKVDRRKLNDVLHQAGKNFVEVEFSQTNHGFFCDERKSFNSQAAMQSWQLTLAFLKSHLS
jgi:carboxymethylenebutenolidase